MLCDCTPLTVGLLHVILGRASTHNGPFTLYTSIEQLSSKKSAYIWYIENISIYNTSYTVIAALLLE